MEKKKNEKNNTVFLIVMFIIVFVLILFMPKIYNLIETSKLPKIKIDEKEKIEEQKKIDAEMLESIHFPIMRNSIYDSNSYYNLDTFKVSDMSNNDILYNAFLDIYEGNIVSSNIKGSCTSVNKQFSKKYIEFRIKNILGKNINYVLEDFYVPEDSNSQYTGNWTYDSYNSVFIYNGLCSSRATNTRYYDLKQLIKSEYDNKDIVIYYYVGFAKVIDNNYTIYSDAQMINEIDSGVFTSIEELNEIYKSINKSKKKTYKYTFKDTLCKYNDYCLYEGKWVNEL